MSVVCPEGHDSEATDYCDTCGTPIGARPVADVNPAVAAAPSPASAAPATASVSASVTCPHCGGANVADALFCEECGYDFTTGVAPMGSPEAQTAAEQPEVEPEPAGASPVAVPEEPEAEPEAVIEAVIDPDPGPRPDPDPGPRSAPETAPPVAKAHPTPRHTPPSRALADTWVVEIWVDPDWYEVQQTVEACPSAGVPDVVLVRRNVVTVGRPSGSRGGRPEVDAGADSAVSRRHAQLTSDGQRWWIEDLGSSNGTFVGTVGEPLPTEAIPPGHRVEIDRDDRIYVGAWTRLVLRQATRAEISGQG